MATKGNKSTSELPTSTHSYPQSEETTVGPIPIESSIDIGSLEPQTHNWVQRGIKVSCEGAHHPPHSHFLVRR